MSTYSDDSYEYSDESESLDEDGLFDDVSTPCDARIIQQMNYLILPSRLQLRTYYCLDYKGTALACKQFRI